MKRDRHHHGFMLLEVIVAVALVAIAFPVLIASLSRCLAAARAVQNYSLVEMLLANKAYEFRVERALDYDDEDGHFDDYPGYTWQRTLDATDTDDLWRQTITIYWYERNTVASEAVVEYRYLPEKQE